MNTEKSSGDLKRLAVNQTNAGLKKYLMGVLNIYINAKFFQIISLTRFSELFYYKFQNYIYIYIYIYICVCVCVRRVGWKIYQLIKRLCWNVTKWALFFNIVSIAVNTLSVWMTSSYKLFSLWTFQLTLV